MTFAQIPPNSTLFIDASIFIYYFLNTSQECKELLLRCQNRSLRGVTSFVVLAEVLHRLMTFEAVQKGVVSSGNVVNKLKQNPDAVKSLSNYDTNVLQIFDFGIEVYPIDDIQRILAESHTFRQNYGLLTNDSLNAAFMRLHGVTHLATNNGDFDALPSIQVFKPTDV
jgi:predicted nucleic acid-binding protein